MNKTLLTALLCWGVFPCFADEAPKVEVTGRVIDVRRAGTGVEAYPQYRHLKFGKSLPAYLQDRTYAVSLKEFEGPEKVRCAEKTELTVAVCGIVPDTLVWKPTGDRFFLKKEQYKIYKAQYNTPGEWMSLPADEQSTSSLMLFADSISVAGTEPVPGTVIARIPELRRGHITNPNIIILEDGSYLALCSGMLEKRKPIVYRSTDSGVTWSEYSGVGYPINFYSIFEYLGDLYLLGTSVPDMSIVVCKSEDNGKTWITPDHESGYGIIAKGEFHSAPVPVVEHKGRLWTSMENRVNKRPKMVLALSAKIGSDIMKSESWTLTEQMPFSETWPAIGDSSVFRQWIEGNIVVTPDGRLVNILRVDEHTNGRTAAVVHIKSRKKLEFDPQKDIIEMPGGGKKFTIRYDNESGKYWSIVSEADDKYKNVTHNGIYANGVHCGLLRNKLTLISSTDLYHWNTEGVLIESDNPFFDGFQYVDWRFDGNDIVAVIRLAMEESRGLPARQHDANFLVFKRIQNFRDGKFNTEQIHTLQK